MTDKEFRRLSRANLIEIIYALQTKEKELCQEIDALKQKLEEQSALPVAAMEKLNELWELTRAEAEERRDGARAIQAMWEDVRRLKEMYQDGS